MNDLEAFADVFDGMTPYSGMVEPGFIVSRLGRMTDARFHVIWGVDPAQEGGRNMTLRLPVATDGEGWFEAVSCVEAAREARGSYVMATLGACYGAQAVEAYLALQALNPMPAKLIAVDPVPENIAMTRQHFQDNGIDPDAHWIVEAALSDGNAPVVFPVGSPGSSTQNCVFYNSAVGRTALARRLTEDGQAGLVGGNLLATNATGVTINMTPEREPSFEAELKLVSAVTVADILGPFDRVDFVEADLQQSEMVVFPPAMEALNRKVRRVHLGTHHPEEHRYLEGMFGQHGWQIVFSFPPRGTYRTSAGEFTLNDGVLTVLNPAVAYG